MIRKSKLAIVLGTVLVLQAPMAQAGVSWGTCRQVLVGQIDHLVEQVLQSARTVGTPDVVKADTHRSVKHVTRRTPAKASHR